MLISKLLYLIILKGNYVAWDWLRYFLFIIRGIGDTSFHENSFTAVYEIFSKDTYMLYTSFHHSIFLILLSVKIYIHFWNNL